ncbi:hypothetical protein AB6D34_02040 [Pectobacterium brasiliense]|uniref:Uncharacterized protein n=1 Tax=Pectobacterium brasiliense TaxID=180957 RepID=A0A3S0ZPD5_9GAMM|nr:MULTISPECIES: hypothetical protein [Pectobacterium]GKW28446.1 hypothetical protein PEC331060_16240 [Pectobacterium carotovorum subsp. carotovorum]MBN3046028.1 hypothetical protein [Pectobacterium brasiliense]MBN3076481.1 hypothetical protein [Pectobacterium brasiliense]MBN3085265.1 hypothetical protein [Pectobacterium brasiliense]MBN3088020.1 hypothetical protein [Pectobacterium brasiliense]
MDNTASEYKKSCADELDFSSINQYHESTMQISNQCFEYKKLCVGALGIIIAAMLKIGPETNPLLLSLTCLFITIGFWMCDTTAYYYQRVNRQKIYDIQTKISNRNFGENKAATQLENSWIAAIFNKSMILYMYCAGVFAFIFLNSITYFLLRNCINNHSA